MTKYEPYQQEECKVQYKKSCQIRHDKKTVSEVVEVCRTPMVKNCDTEAVVVDDDSDDNVECKTVYESECWTKYEKHEVATICAKGT